MLRRLFIPVLVLSLLVCVATSCLGMLSLHQRIAPSRIIRGDRYCLIFAGGQIGLYGPPPAAADPIARKASEETVAALHNDQIKWLAWFTEGDLPHRLDVVHPPVPLPDTPAAHAEQAFRPRDLTRPLLAALEDPQRVTAAHVLLYRGSKQWPWSLDDSGLDMITCTSIPNHLLDRSVRDTESLTEGALWAQVDVDGLKISLSRWGKPDKYINGDGFTSLGAWRDRVDGDPDVTDMPKIREQ